MLGYVLGPALASPQYKLRHRGAPCWTVSLFAASAPAGSLVPPQHRTRRCQVLQDMVVPQALLPHYCVAGDSGIVLVRERLYSPQHDHPALQAEVPTDAPPERTDGRTDGRATIHCNSRAKRVVAESSEWHALDAWPRGRVAEAAVVAAAAVAARGPLLLTDRSFCADFVQSTNCLKPNAHTM